MEKEIDLSNLINVEMERKYGIDIYNAKYHIDNLNRITHIYGKRKEKEYACVMDGKITYLTEHERVKIIKGNGPDFDTLPDDLDIPYERFREIPCEILFHITIVKEWDGELIPAIARSVGTVTELRYSPSQVFKVPTHHFRKIRNDVFNITDNKSEYW